MIQSFGSADWQQWAMRFFLKKFTSYSHQFWIRNCLICLMYNIQMKQIRLAVCSALNRKSSETQVVTPKCPYNVTSHVATVASLYLAQPRLLWLLNSLCCLFIYQSPSLSWQLCDVVWGRTPQRGLRDSKNRGALCDKETQQAQGEITGTESERGVTTLT